MVKSKVSQRTSTTVNNLQTPDQSRYIEQEVSTPASEAPAPAPASRRIAGAIRDILDGIRQLTPLRGLARANIVELEPRELFGPSRPPPTMAEMWGHSNSHVWPMDQTILRRDVTDPDQYQWYIQQLARNKADKLYSTQMDIREANEHGGAILGNDIMHGSRVVNLPKQRTDGVFTPIRQAAIDQGILRPTNRWREKLKVPHKQRMVAQQSRADLMCLQRWKTNGPDYPVMLSINPNIAPLTVRRKRVPSGYKPFRAIGDRSIFGPYS